MTRIGRFAATLLVASFLSTPAASQPAQRDPRQQDEFVPIDQLPPQDQLPAAPLVIAAYAFVWLAVGGYIWSVARRVASVQREVERLDADLKRSGRT